MAAEPARIGQSVDGPASAGPRAVPLFHAACLFAAGIVFANRMWLRPSLLLVALALLVGLAAISAVRALRIALLPLALIWLLLGAWCAEVEPHPAPSPSLATASDGLLRTVEGTVVNAGMMRSNVEQNRSEPPTSPATQTIDLRVSSVEQVTDQIDAEAPAAGGVRLIVRWLPGAQPLPFRCGERVRATVRLMLPDDYHDPGAWSRTDYLLDEGITATASVSIQRVERIGIERSRFVACRLNALQHSMTARLLALPASMRSLPAPLRLTRDDAAMLAAMVAGDRTYLTHTLRLGFERTGSFHMLVVSGFHLALVAGFIFWIAARLRLPRTPATLLTIAASFAYALFTGFATPVQRSLWMVSLYLLGRLIYRERSPLNVIGFAALCLLVASPRSLFDSSFQMTLLAVVSIAGIAAPLLQATIHPYAAAARELRLTALDVKLAPALAAFRVALRIFAGRIAAVASDFIGWRIFPWTARAAIRILELLAISCVVEIAMTLSMAIDFHRITLFALPVNLLILPLLAVLMPAALLTLVALLVSPAAAVAPAMATAAVLHAGVWLVHLFGSMRFGDLRIPTPLLWQSAAFCLLLGAAIALAHSGLRSQVRWPRRAAWAALLLAGMAAVLPRPLDRPREAMLLQVIDVGQGDSLLLITPDGKTLLVDGGGFGGGPRLATQNFDIGEQVVSPVLWTRGIRRLDAVALSHAHSDHLGGLPAVLRNFRPRELWVGNNPPTPAYLALLAEAAELHIRVRSFRAGDAFPFGSTHIHVLAPLLSYHPGAEPANDDSMVLHVTYGATSALLEGDAEQPIETGMLDERGLRSTFLKVGHHGSSTSTTPDFLVRVRPQWASISCGPHNRYGHPRPQVLAALQAAHTRTYRTDIEGASCFVLDGRTAIADYTCGWRGLQ
ncbi:MAG: ComEC/Rec2 family competence protein [Acidobacteriota bacterium]